jgi:hypothetical protein
MPSALRPCSPILPLGFSIVAVHDYFTAEEQLRQDALNRSWAAAQAHVADPGARRRIDAALADLDSRPPAPAITPSEFLVSVGVGGMAGVSDRLDDPAG